MTNYGRSDLEQSEEEYDPHNVLRTRKLAAIVLSLVVSHGCVAGLAIFGGRTLERNAVNREGREVRWTGRPPNGTIAAQVCTSTTVSCYASGMCTCGDITLSEEALLYEANPSLD